MEYIPYQAYPNHHLHYPTINYIPSDPQMNSSSKPKKLQPMIHMPSLVPLIPNLSSKHLSERPSQKPNIKQFHFDPILMTYMDLLLVLIQSGLIIPAVRAESLKSPYPRWYDKNISYEFHLGVQGSVDTDQWCSNIGYHYNKNDLKQYSLRILLFKILIDNCYKKKNFHYIKY